MNVLKYYYHALNGIKNSLFMKVIKTVGELKTLIKAKVLPAYEKAYADEDSDFEELYMDAGICWYCKKALDKDVFRVMKRSIAFDWICKEVITDGCTKEEAILPRIEWMREFING